MNAAALFGHELSHALAAALSGLSARSVIAAQPDFYTCIFIDAAEGLVTATPYQRLATALAGPLYDAARFEEVDLSASTDAECLKLINNDNWDAGNGLASDDFHAAFAVSEMRTDLKTIRQAIRIARGAAAGALGLYLRRKSSFESLAASIEADPKNGWLIEGGDIIAATGGLPLKVKRARALEYR